MDKYNILIFDEQGFFYGSTQKLERQMAKILAREFNVYFAYGNGYDAAEAKQLEEAGVKLIENHFDYRKKREPHTLVGMRPKIMEIIRRNNIRCVYCVAFAHYQFPINSIPASVPLVLISPFGHYSSNGNVAKTYVSGKGNRDRIIGRGVKNVETFFNPLTDYPPDILNKHPVGETVVFGRIGNDKDYSFDPIALLAFKKLEDIYGDQVKFLVVNPAPAWLETAKKLGMKNIEYRPTITDFSVLGAFYKEIDVLAHVRKDGETVGIAIAEAMLAGNPILTHKSHFHNDHFDLLSPDYSKFSDADNSGQYFENMKWMVENKSQIRAMGRLARKRALEIFSLEAQAPKIIADFQQACARYYDGTFWGRIKGYVILYCQNFKAIPFVLGKAISNQFPGAYKIIRKFYYT